MEASYKLVKRTSDLKNSGGGNIVVGKFDHFSTALKALKATDKTHFVQGPRRAFFFEDYAASPETASLVPDYSNIAYVIAAGISIETIQ